MGERDDSWVFEVEGGEGTGGEGEPMAFAIVYTIGIIIYKIISFKRKDFSYI